MKDKIKEIIDNLIRFRNENSKFQPEDILTIEDVWLLLDYITNLQEENKRLNNIINELEKYLEQQWLEWKDDSNDEIVAMAKEDKVILDKLKELKGSDK